MNSLRKAYAQAAAVVPRHARRFGGDRRYRHPEVYSPAGGWWNDNPNAKRNTAIVFATVFSLAIPVAVTSMQNEVRPRARGITVTAADARCKPTDATACGCFAVVVHVSGVAGGGVAVAPLVGTGVVTSVVQFSQLRVFAVRNMFCCSAKRSAMYFCCLRWQSPPRSSSR